LAVYKNVLDPIENARHEARPRDEKRREKQKRNRNAGENTGEEETEKKGKELRDHTLYHKYIVVPKKKGTKSGREKKIRREKTLVGLLLARTKKKKKILALQVSRRLSRGLTILFLDNDFGGDFTGVAVCRTIGVLSGSRSSSRSSRGSSSIVSCRDRRSPRPV